MSLLAILLSPAHAAPAGKIEICHATSSATNPYVVIEVSRNSWDKGSGHGAHAGDFEAVGGSCSVSACDDLTDSWTLTAGESDTCVEVDGDTCGFSFTISGVTLSGSSSDGTNFTLEDPASGVSCTGTRDGNGDLDFTCDVGGQSLAVSLSDAGGCEPGECSGDDGWDISNTGELTGSAGQTTDPGTADGAGCAWYKNYDGGDLDIQYCLADVADGDCVDVDGGDAAAASTTSDASGDVFDTQLYAARVDECERIDDPPETAPDAICTDGGGAAVGAHYDNVCTLGYETFCDACDAAGGSTDGYCY